MFSDQKDTFAFLKILLKLLFKILIIYIFNPKLIPNLNFKYKLVNSISVFNFFTETYFHHFSHCILYF